MHPLSGQKRISFNLPDLCKGARPSLARADTAAGLFADYVLNVIKILNLSPTGAALVQTACLRDTTVGLDVLLEPSSSFYYASHNRIDLGYQPDILQKTEKGLGRYLVSLIAGLRRSFHHHHDFILTPHAGITRYIEYTRVLQADVEAITHLIAWELRTAGTGFFWRHLLSLKNADIAAEFERLAQEDPRHVFHGGALMAAFDRWYEDEGRIASADRFALEMIDLALISQDGDDTGYSLLSGGLQGAGLLPSGCNYLSGSLFQMRLGTIPLALENLTYLRLLEKDVDQILEKQK